MSYINPYKLTPRQREIRKQLLRGEGEPVLFGAQENADDREIPAELIREAVLAGVPVEIHYAVIKGHMNFKEVEAKGALILRGCSIESFDATGAQFHQALDLSYAEWKSGKDREPTSVFGLFSVLNARLEGGLWLNQFVHLAADSRQVPPHASMSHARVQVGLRADDAKFEGGIMLDGCRIQGGLHLPRAHFGGACSFAGLRVADQAVFESVTFDREVGFFDSAIELGISFDPGRDDPHDPCPVAPSEKWPPTKFVCPAFFDRMKVGGQFRCRFAQFDSVASFNGLRVKGQAVFYSARAKRTSIMMSHVGCSPAKKPKCGGFSVYGAASDAPASDTPASPDPASPLSASPALASGIMASGAHQSTPASGYVHRLEESQIWPHSQCRSS